MTTAMVRHAQIARNFGHNGSRARARAAAHAGGDEYQIRALERLSDLLAAFLRRTAGRHREPRPRQDP